MAGRHVFISYSSTDSAAAQRILRALEARGIACWISSRDVPPGSSFAAAIVEAIENAYAMILVFSANANQRAEEIKKEIVLAGQNNLVVVPARIENLLPSDRAFRYELATRQWVDLFDNWDNGIDRMSDTLLKLRPAGTVPGGAGTATASPPPVAPPAGSPPPQPGISFRIPLPRLRLPRGGAVLAIVGVLAFAGVAAGAWFGWQAWDHRQDEQAQELTRSGLRNLQTGQYQKAIDELTEAIRLDPSISDAWKWRGSSHALLGRYQEAARDYQQAVKLDPKDFEVWRVLGNRVYLTLGDQYAARRAMDRAIELRPKIPALYLERSYSRVYTGDQDGAMADLNEAIALDPRLAEAYRLRGSLYGVLRQYDRAWPEFEQAIQLDPNNPRSYQLRADVRQGMGDMAGAQSDRAKAMSLGGTPTATPPQQQTTQPQPPMKPLKQ